LIKPRLSVFGETLPVKATLNNCKNITLDIDTSEVIANKADAQWTYKGNLTENHAKINK
jgi:hypothetical protein